MAKTNPTNAGRPFLSERGKVLLFAALTLVALLLAAYIIFFPLLQDKAADGSEFYTRLQSADKVGILYDVRGAQGEQASAIYQCGVDMIGKGRFAGKSLEIIACEDNGCLSIATDVNGTNNLTFGEAKSKMSSMPYISISPGAPSYKFFERHMEISIGENVTGNSTCDISASEG